MRDKKYPSVLVCAPQHNSKDYAFPEWIERVSQFTYPNFSVYLHDNSEKNNFAKYMRKFGIDTDWKDPKGKSMDQKLAESHEACRQYAIRYEFDFMLHLETDIIPPVNIIELLLSAMNTPYGKRNLTKNVVGATYHIYEGTTSRLMVHLGEENPNEYFKNTTKMDKDLLTFLDGTVKQVYAIGLGCLLIKRAVFLDTPFRYEKGVDLRPDGIFASDLFNKGIVQWCDTSIICQHRNKRWGIYGADFK